MEQQPFAGKDDCFKVPVGHSVQLASGLGRHLRVLSTIVSKLFAEVLQ